MSLLPIRVLGDPVLRRETVRVDAFTPELHRLIDDMFETMHAAKGVGLAAPQVGRSERLTVVDVQGFGRQKGQSEIYRVHELTVNMMRKVQLQIAVNEDFVEPTVNAIIEAARTGGEGRIGDGKIFILPLEDCIRIRTGERGPEAI